MQFIVTLLQIAAGVMLALIVSLVPLPRLSRRLRGSAGPAGLGRRIAGGAGAERSGAASRSARRPIVGALIGVAVVLLPTFVPATETPST
jgi:hypothetical protein